VTKSYYDFDRAEGSEAWPDADPSDDVGYAPSPSGAYLTDGVLALTAALTSNSAVSAWAFTDFKPGLEKVDGTDYSVGEFTHYLLFEHEFPRLSDDQSDDQSIGMTAALTALSSAIDWARWDAQTEDALSAAVSAAVSGPLHDTKVLQALAHDAAEGSGCSFNPLDYGHCVVSAVKAVWRWVKRWGHLVLDILTLSTFAPPPFSAVGAAAAATNATWYAIDGDFGAAGLSLAAAVPGLGFTKIAKATASAKASTTALNTERVAAESEKVAKAARWWRPNRPWKDCDLLQEGVIRLKYKAGWSAAQRKAADQKVKAIYEAGQRGELAKTRVTRSSASAKSRYEGSGGRVRDGHDVDHTVELQLGGADDRSNMKPLDASVNRSIGKQIELQLANVDYGTAVLGAAIC
jgi:hypothetical protein